MPFRPMFRKSVLLREQSDLFRLCGCFVAPHAREQTVCLQPATAMPLHAYAGARPAGYLTLFGEIGNRVGPSGKVLCAILASRPTNKEYLTKFDEPILIMQITSLTELRRYAPDQREPLSFVHWPIWLRMQLVCRYPRGRPTRRRRMAESSGINWSDLSFTPWRGCQAVSAACASCCADRTDWRAGLTSALGPHGERQRTSPADWRQTLRWNAEGERTGMPRRVFASTCPTSSTTGRSLPGGQTSGAACGAPQRSRGWC